MAELTLSFWVLVFLGPFLAVGLPGLIAFFQWPVPSSSRPRSSRPVYAGVPQMAGARW